MGLNESYNHIRSDVLLKTPVLMVNQDYALVVQEQRQRVLGVDDNNRESLSLLAGRTYSF